MKVAVDQETCTGCGLCADTCPEIFEMIEDDKADAKTDLVPADLESCCREAADGCPVSAIQCESDSRPLESPVFD